MGIIRKVDKYFHIRYDLVILSYIVACVYYWYTRVCSPINEVLNINYILAFTILLSFDYTKIDKFKIALFILLPICAVVFRRWLVIWTIFALVYQIGYYNIGLRTIGKLSIIILVIELFIQFELFLLGIVEDTPKFVVKTERYAHDLGMGNSNQFGMLIFELCCMIYLFIGINKGKRLLFTIITIIVGCIMFYFTSCRTAFYSILLLNILAFGYWLNLFSKYYKILIGILPFIFFALNVYTALFYEDMSEFNEISTGRMWYMKKYLDDFSSTDWLVGAVVESSDPLDGTYLEMLLKGGIVMTIFFSCSFFISIVKYYNEIKK